jgi:glycosyltransferase involved in cell wall biosynthesis
MKIMMLGCLNSIHALRPLNLLLESGHQVLYLDNKNPFPSGRPGFRYSNYPYIGRCSYRKVGPFLGRLISKISYIPYLKWLGQDYDPDIIHVHWVDCHADYCVRAGLKPLVLSVWGSDINNSFQPGADPYHARVLGHALSHSDLVVIDSPEMKEKCEILAGKTLWTELVHLGVDTDLFKPASQEVKNKWKKKLEIPEEGKVLLSIRAIAPIYQQVEILEAFSLVRKRVNFQIYLVFKQYNIDLTYQSILLARIKELGLDDWVRWISGVSNECLPELYTFTDLIINFPRQDTFPITFIEAAACETPVVTCNLPAYGGTFAERSFGMVKENTIAGLADAIQNDLKDRAERSQDLATLREEVIKKFDQSNYLRKLEMIYAAVKK